jgi:hypothetical protein
MPYNEETVLRIRNVLYNKDVTFTETKMFGGICFMVNNKMCCGTHIDKKTNQDVLLCRIGESEYEKALENENCIPMEFTGKPMLGFVYIIGDGIKSEKELSNWLQLCLNYNPLAKKRKKKK